MLKILRKIFFGLLIFMAAVAAVLASGYPLGLYLEPKLEGVLTTLFGMPVTIDGLRANPFNGHATAKRIRFMNQAEFSKGPHLDTSARFKIDYWKLRDKQVVIPYVYLQNPYYLIERIPAQEKDSHISNVQMWVRHIKAWKAARNANKTAEEKAEEEADDSPGWQVSIPKIYIQNGTFIYYGRERVGNNFRRFVFQQMEGSLFDFKWPGRGPENFDQRVNVKGLFNEKYPAPFWVKGIGNFATSEVGFNLEGEIHEGHLIEHRFLFTGLPFGVKSGRYDLFLHLLCIKGELKSVNQLLLKEINVKPRKSATGIVWGLPAVATVRFLESQKVVDLQVPVNGDITDPHFGFTRAFRQAFQKALFEKTSGGIKMLSEPVITAAQKGGEAMLEAPAKMMQQIEKLPELVKGRAPAAASVTVETPKDKPAAAAQS